LKRAEANKADDGMEGEREHFDGGGLDKNKVVVLASVFDHSFRQVGAPGFVAAAREFGGQVSGAAADVQDLRSCRELRFDHLDRKTSARDEILRGKIRGLRVLVETRPIVYSLRKQLVNLLFGTHVVLGSISIGVAVAAS